MGSFNRATLVGNLGRDADLRYTQGGQAVCSLSLATTEVWTDKAGQKQEKTDWWRINVWGKTAETLAQYLTKGKQILVEGKLENREWEKDGVKRTSTEIRADRVVLLGGGQGRTTSEDSRELVGASVGDHDRTNDDSDIPF